MNTHPTFRRWLGFLTLAALSPAALATWSIIIIDTRTREIAIGSATCLTNFNLLRGLPVVLVDVGAAAAQSSVDGSGVNRRRIWDGLLAGKHPEEILAILLETDASHQSRQYGIVDVKGNAVTASGSLNGAYANGLTGRVGTLVYAIQGNVITGQPVLDQAELAILNTPGGLPEKLMASMQAARSMGGDGRCSCRFNDPVGCGSPPPTFTKSAHIGFMVVTRRGDVDGTCSQDGCANGTYYMRFNIRTQDQAAPDPVLQLQQLFDNWRASLIAEPDAVESLATISPPALPADGSSSAELIVETLDWTQQPASATTSLIVDHDDGSAGSCHVGPVTDLGNGRFSVTLTAGTTFGTDRFRITATGSLGPRILIPSPTLTLAAPIRDVSGKPTVPAVSNTPARRSIGP